MIKLTMIGAAGRMGQAILNLAAQDKQIKIVAGVDHKKCPLVGKDIGEMLGRKKIGVAITTDVTAALKLADVAIDFSHFSALSANLTAATKTKTGYVVGTTALEEKHLRALKTNSKKIAIVQSPNMSIGVNLLFRLAELTSKALDESYDIEIVEAHHRMKKDAPSGTAMKLLEVCSEARKKNIKKNTVYGRKGEVGARPKGEIAVMTLRGGDVVGDHTVHYMAEGERVELTHKASSRDAFAGGALRAAKFVARKRSGLYNMQQVLGIK